MERIIILMDIIDIKTSEPNLLKIDKKSHRDFDIYHIGYNMIKNLMIVIVIMIMKIFFILDSNKKYKEVLFEIKSEIITINGGKWC